MAIVQAVANSFKQELLKAVHDFTSHTFKLALYTDTADLGAATTAYSASNEVSGAGYTAGGATLTVVGGAVSLSGTAAFVDFADVSWASATFVARGALLYNATAAGTPAVAVLDFGTPKTAANNTFTVQFPVSDADSAIVRVY